MRAKITFADTLDMGVLGGSSHRRERGNRNETRRDADRKLAAATVPRLVREGLAMRKAFLSAGVVAITWSMFHGAFACEFNRGADRQDSVVVADCGGSGCMYDPLQNPFAPLLERTTPGPAQDCGASYFDPDIYTGTNGLVVWLMATVVAESQYRPGAGFAPSPMDANAQYR